MGSSSSRLRVIKVESDGSRPKKAASRRFNATGFGIVYYEKHSEIAIQCDEWMNMTRACGRPFLALVVLKRYPHRSGK